MYTIYTDGSTKGNGRVQNSGGWAYIVTENNFVKYYNSGSTSNTTNQRMELTACIQAMEYCYTHLYDPGEKIVIATDSAYLANCYIQKWYVNWEKNGWKNSKGEPVANQDLWEKLVPFFKKDSFVLHKVKGHAAEKNNNLADKLAQAAADGRTLSRDCLITEGFI